MAPSIKVPPANVPGQASNQKVHTNPSAVPTVSYTPTDTTIPPSLYDKISNLESYKKLIEAEQRIDLLNTRKALDLQAINMKLAQESSFKRDKGTLRVFIYNTCESQPWQKQLAKERGQDISNLSSDPSFTLRVEGRFINEDENRGLDEVAPNLKFSSFLSGISIDLIQNENYPEMKNSNLNMVEWRSELNGQPIDSKFATGNRQSEFDGLDVKRNGMFNIKAKVAILLKEHSSRLKLSDALAHFAGKEVATQQEVIYLIWQYAIYKNLFKNNTSKVPVISGSETALMNGTDDGTQNSNQEDLTLVECDLILSDLLKVSSFKFSDLFKLIQPHFAPRSPIILEYEINTRKSTTLGDLVIDIPVELPYSSSKTQKEIMESTKATYERQAKADAVIQQLNNKIALGIVALQNLNSRELFYRELSQDPVEFVRKWLESQLEAFKALKSDEGYEEEVVRKAGYFEEHEDLLRDKIDVLLGSGRF